MTIVSITGHRRRSIAPEDRGAVDRGRVTRILLKLLSKLISYTSPYYDVRIFSDLFQL